MYAIIRVRGKSNVRKEVEDTMKMLKLNKKNSCALVPENKNYEGMIKKIKDQITWGEISKDNIQKLLEKRRKMDKKEAKKMTKELLDGKRKLKKSFKLSPPSKGFKGSIKQHYPKGALGNREEKINDLLKRMI